jgi:3-hydroxy-3-methylglutaryl CoA synthase
MKLKLVASTVLAAFLVESVAFAVDSKGAAYFGGTVSAFNDAKNPVEGKLNTKKDDALVFTADDRPFVGQSLSIRYSDIIDLEYGQKAGRRVGAAAATTILLGPIGLLTLFSKKRNHYLTIGFKGEDGKDQVAVIELGKDIVRTTIPIVETRSGKRVVYQDDEARKSVK